VKVWQVFIEDYNEGGELVNVEVVMYDNEQTARQHADRDGARVGRGDVRSTLRQY
jgi:hypothetical protein